MNNTKTRAIRAITISVALALGFGAAAASAGTSDFVGDGFNKYVVKFPDLDLNKAEGAAALYGRLRRAAAIVCSPLDGRGRAFNTSYRACMGQAVASAVERVGRPMLSQYHESQIKGDKTAMTQLARAN